MTSDEFLKRLDTRLDKLDSRLGNVDVTLAKQAVSLDEHMRRTELLEDHTSRLHKEIEPLKKAAHMWAGVGKGLAVGGSVVGFVAGVLKLVHAI